jgi:uncharacterized protein (TIGR03086 family)
MDALQALGQARQEFEQRLALVQDDQWDNPTPCEEWDVRTLVNHVMLGNRMTVQLLGGMATSDVIAGLNDDLLGEAEADVRGAFASVADDVHASFAADGALDGTVQHPMGEIPRTMFIGFRACDYAVHAWDLARGISADDQLDEDMVQWLWEDCQPMKDGLAATGMFGEGASGTVGDDASVQHRYLDTFGRRP